MHTQLTLPEPRFFDHRRCLAVIGEVIQVDVNTGTKSFWHVQPVAGGLGSTVNVYNLAEVETRLPKVIIGVNDQVFSRDRVANPRVDNFVNGK